MAKGIQLKISNEKAYPQTVNHITKIQSTIEKSDIKIYNGRPSGPYVSHDLVYRAGDGNKMYEYYGGICIPNIEDYEVIIADLNFGGNTDNGQMAGAVIVYTDTNGTLDSEYGDGWANMILCPKTDNYDKVEITKVIYVGDRIGPHVIGSVWQAYKGTFSWTRGFGPDGCSLTVYGIRRMSKT